MYSYTFIFKVWFGKVGDTDQSWSIPEKNNLCIFVKNVTKKKKKS